MTNYVKTTNFLRKDSLPDASTEKIIRGSEFDTEFNNLVIAVASKANLISPVLSGVPMAPTATAGSATTQIATTAFSTAAAVKATLTVGCVIMWYGSSDKVPTGWAVCDGTNGTPNLKNKFVIGAGGTYGVNIPGGYADAQLPTHTHAGSTNSAGAHAHSTLNGYTGEYGNGAVAPGVTGPLFTSTMDKTSTEGAHTHTVTVNAAGASATNKNLPPFLALFYIMKI